MDRGIVTAIIGVVLLLQGLRMFPVQRRLARSGQTVMGEIVGYTTRTRSRRYTYMPHVRFEGPRGAQEFVSSMSADPKEWPKGTAVPVRYFPRTPDQAEIATAGRRWLAPLLFSLIGGALLAIWIVRNLAV